MKAAKFAGRFRARAGQLIRTVWGPQFLTEPDGHGHASRKFSYFEQLEKRQLLSSIAINNGVLTMTGDAGTSNQFTLWVSADHSQSWAIVNGQQKKFDYSQYNSVRIVENSASDSITIDARNNKPVATTTLSSGSNSTGGSTNTGGAQQPGISINNGVLTMVGNAGMTNQFTLWVSGDHTQSWAIVNGQQKKISYNQYNSVQIVENSPSDSITIDARNNKPVATTTLSSGSNSTGGSTNTGGAQQPGISINNGVLTMVGNAGMTNQFTLWVSADHTKSWAIVNGHQEQFNYNQYNSVQIVENNPSDSITIDARNIKPVATTTLTGGSNDNGGTTNTGGGSDSGGQTPSDPPPSVDSGPAPEAVITMVSGTTIMAGQQVNAQAMNSVLNAGSPTTAHYEWNFGDSGGKYNDLVGFNAAHIYDTPGVYTLRLTVTNQNGATSTTTQTITVTPNTQKPIYVDSVYGNDANDGSSPNQAIQSIDRAQQLLTNNTQLLFRSGETFTTSTGLKDPYSNTTIGSYGNGAAPMLRWTGPMIVGSSFIATSSVTQNLVVQNLQFDAGVINQPGMPDGISAYGHNLAVLNCTFVHIGDGINANGNPDGLLVQDNSSPNVDGLDGYFVWLQGADSVIIGNSVANSSRQHDIRGSVQYTRTLIADNNLTNLDRRPIDPYDYSKCSLDMQWGSDVYIRGNTVTDGSIRVGPLGGPDEMQANPTGYMNEQTTNCVVEDNTLIQTDLNFAHGLNNCIARNNIIYYDNNAGVQVDGYNPTYNQSVMGLQLLNNTDINNGTTGNFLWLNGQAQNMVMDNNLYIAPNMAVGGYNTSPVYVNAPDLSSFSQINGNVWQTPSTSIYGLHGGVNMVRVPGSNATYNYQTPAWWNAQNQVGTDLFSATPIQRNGAPTSGSAAATFARAVPGVSDDFYGNARPANGIWSAGAIQL